jgi:ankyrin repeat protein
MSACASRATLAALVWTVTLLAGCRPNLFDAIDRDDVEQVRQILREHPELVNATEGQSASPLHYAAGKSKLEMVKALLEAGERPNIRDDHGFTALMLTDGSDVMEYLLEHGADISAVNQWRRTALHHIARRKGPAAIEAVRLLLARGANAAVKDAEGKTALDFALDADNSEIAEILRRQTGR